MSENCDATARDDAGNLSTTQSTDLDHAAVGVTGGGKPGEEIYFSEGRLLPEHFPAVIEQLREAAKRYGHDLSWLDLTLTLDELKAIAKSHGFVLAGMYSRCSTGLQDSYPNQIAQCVDRGMMNKAVLVPDLISGDQGITGKKKNRPGINRFKGQLANKQMDVALAFSLTRISRTKYEGMRFITEDNRAAMDRDDKKGHV